jgi:arylsulfatase A-like enzyme
MDRYDSEIRYVDHHIGELLKTIDDLQLRENTLVVLTSDHGESLGEHDYVGHGRHLFENIVRVPLIFRLPGKIPPGKVVDTPVSLIDLAPTVIDLTVRGMPKFQEPPIPFTGRSLASAFTDARLSPREVHYLTFAGKKGFAPTWLSWLWIQKSELPLQMGHTDGTRKSVWIPASELVNIFDLRKDPQENAPRTVSGGASAYRIETASLGRWFKATEARAVEEKLTREDLEVLKSLGYVQ